MIWRWLYDYNFGLLNWALSWFGVGKINWLGDPRWSMFAVILAAIGAGPGGNILIYLAGLARVPSECIEAARVDGANAVQRWWHVTLPLLRPITLYLVVLNTIGSFQVFELVFTLTSGGPASSSTVLVYEIYSLAFANGYYGQAGALSLLLLLIVTGFAVLQFKIFRTDLEETRPPTIFDKAIDGVSNLIEWTAGGVWNLIQIPSELLKKRRATARGTGQLRPKLRLRLLPFFTKNAAHVILMPSGRGQNL